MKDTELTFLSWAENSPIGFWVSTSLWGYPIVLTLHTIGMATLVGITLMLSIRVLGFSNGMSLASLSSYWKIALIGFGINLLSGTALFFGSATVLWESWPFRLKIILIALGLLLSHQLIKNTAKGKVTIKEQSMAVTVIFIWLTALVAGRLIAYID